MRKGTVFTIATLFLLAVATAGAQNAAVNFGTTEQTIRGFGGATAFLGQLTVPQATALFSPTEGLGLSILRVRIAPTGSATSTPPWAVTTPNSGGWFDEVTNAKEAVAANPNAIVFATPWTPPASMKSSSSSQPFFNGACGTGSGVSGFCGGFLPPANYAAYAQYLEDFVTYFDNNAGFNLYAISMQNEPDFANVNFESCNWTAAQMDAWIAGNAKVLTTKLIMPESFQFIQAQGNTALQDPSAEPLISIVGGHLYGSSPSVYPLAVQNGKELWMTEHMFTPAGSQPAIGDALQLAEEIHNSMVVGSYSAYVYWWIWDDPADGVNFGLINSNTTAPVPTYYGDAIGQFSSFIQPGYVRVSATANPVSGVDVSAYSGAGNDVIVAINSNSSATSVTFSLTGSTASSFTPHQTSASAQLAKLSAVSVSGNAFTYSLPAQSITTFVSSGTSGTPCAAAPAAPAGVTATASSSGINLSWTAVTPPANCSISSYNVFRSTTSGFTPSSSNQVASVTSGTTFSDTGLAASTTYFYVVEAVDSAGASAASTQASATTGSTSASTCSVHYAITPQNSSAFGATVAIKNNGTTTLSNWTLAWSFGNGQTIANSWNGTVSQTGANVTVGEQSGQTWENIPAGGSYTGFGFNGTWNGVTNSVPAAFSLNGTACTVN
jgi:glucuronoarabinoxylan endo-1,4-beta-xylanase